MTTKQTIDGVLIPRATLESLIAKAYGEKPGNPDFELDELRALLDEPAVESRNKCGVQMVDCPECTHQWDHFFDCGNRPAAQPQGEPVAFTAVGVLRADGDGGLVPEWILEGGTAELWAGAVLLIADEDQELCAEDGHCELYRAPAEQPAPVEDMVGMRGMETAPRDGTHILIKYVVHHYTDGNGRHRFKDYRPVGHKWSEFWFIDGEFVPWSGTASTRQTSAPRSLLGGYRCHRRLPVESPRLGTGSGGPH